MTPDEFRQTFQVGDQVTLDDTPAHDENPITITAIGTQEFFLGTTTSPYNEVRESHFFIDDCWVKYTPPPERHTVEYRYPMQGDRYIHETGLFVASCNYYASKRWVIVK